MLSFRRLRWLLLAFLGLAFSQSVAAQVATGLSDQALNGRQLYREAQSPYGNQLTAYVGTASVPLPATALPCMGCHGRDGLGRPEGGLVPSNIRWDNLAKAYGGESENGRHFSQYTEKSFYRALTQGIDSAGNKLDPGMPRFDVSMREARALVAYLKNINKEPEPGISAADIQLASILPENEQLQGLRQAIGSTLQAAIDDVNQGGGIYGRQLRLQVATIQRAEQLLPLTQKLMEANENFALLSSFTGEQDQGVADLTEKYHVPNVAPYSAAQYSVHSEKRQTFYLFAGEEIRAKTLLDYTRTNLGITKDQVLLLRAPENNIPWAEPLLGRENILNTASDGQLPEKQRQRLGNSGGRALIYQGEPKGLLKLGEQLQAMHWRGLILLTQGWAAGVVQQLPLPLQSRVLLAQSLVADGYTPQGQQRFLEFHQRHQLPRRYLAAQVHAYTAVQLLVEGLKRAGKSLRRENFVQAMESISGFNAGMAPPLSYGAGRRVGIQGAYILALDDKIQRLRPLTSWLSYQ